MQNLEVMVMLFTMVILGYTACKLGYMGDKFDKKLSSIVVDITCPLLVLSSVMGDEMPDRSLILPLVGVGFLTYIILLVFGFWVPRFISKNHDDQGMIGFSLMFANVGFIGYPIVASIFGPKAVFYAALLNVPNTFFIFTAGVMLVKGEYSIRQFNPKVLLSPALIGAFIAALLVAFGVHTPEMIARPITMVGNHYCARSTDDYRQFDGTSSTSRDYRFWQGLCHLLPPTGDSASVRVFSVPSMRSQHAHQQHQHGSNSHASGVFRHNVLYEVRQKSLTHDRSDIHHDPVLHHYHSSHHPAFWSIE